MGIPSVSILLHEIIKLMYHAKAKEPIFFRIGTCGGIGIDGGNVIITEEALNADLKPYHELVSLINDAFIHDVSRSYLRYYEYYYFLHRRYSERRFAVRAN
jgi:hypothetical protein